jgi:hypothetical protein
MVVVGDAKNLVVRRELRQGPSIAKRMVEVGGANLSVAQRVLKVALTTA